MDDTLISATLTSGAQGRIMDAAMEDALPATTDAQEEASARAQPMEVEVHADVLRNEQTLDPCMLECAQEMFPGGPSWPVLPSGSRMARLPTNFELKSATKVIENLFLTERARFEVKAGVYLQQSEARGYLLAVLFGRGLLSNAQTAHDVGNKAGKQVTAAAVEATTKGKAARKRQPPEVRDAKAATARQQVWGQYFDVFAGLQQVPKGAPMPKASDGREAIEAWAGELRPASTSRTTGDRVPLAPLNRQSAPAIAAAPACSPTTDETPRHIRLRPPEADDETPEGSGRFGRRATSNRGAVKVTFFS